MFLGGKERVKNDLRIKRKRAFFQRRGLRSAGLVKSGNPYSALWQNPKRWQVLRGMIAWYPREAGP